MTNIKPFEAYLPTTKLLDNELIELLARRGYEESCWFKRIRLIYWAACVCIGILIGLLGLTLNSGMAIVVVGVPFALLYVVGALKAHAVTRAFNSRQYSRVLKILPDAFMWNWIGLPFTALQINKCIEIVFSLLLYEGRYSELEAVSRYAWALYERRAISNGVPKRWGIANNLAIAFFCQDQFIEASKIFEVLLKTSKNVQQRVFALNNLALSLAYLDQCDRAETFIEEGFKLNTGKEKSPIGFRLHFAKGFILLRSNRLDESEMLLLTARELAGSLNLGTEVIAACDAMIGQLRFKQQRLEEAFLYYQNALSAYESAPNPAYLAIARLEHERAHVFEAAGDLAASNDSLQRTEIYVRRYFERERATVEFIRRRLENPRKIWIGTQLLNPAREHAAIDLDQTAIEAE